MYQSVFEQFQFHWGMYHLEALLLWLDEFLYSVGYFWTTTVTLEECSSWFNFIRYYFDCCGIEKPLSVVPFDIHLFLCRYEDRLFSSIVLRQCQFIFAYLSSNWISSLALVIFIIVLLLCLMPLNIVGRGRFLVSVLLRMGSVLYSFFYGLVDSYLKHDTRNFFPFIFYIFMFVSLLNLCGMLPYSFVLTSHLIMTSSIACISWGGLLLYGFRTHGLRFFSIFYPKGLPFYLVPFICIIEVVSHVFRVVSLALRLFSNIVAGHILLEIVSMFLFKLAISSIFAIKFVIFMFGLVIIVVLFFFECAICILQGYIFAVLSCIYCRDYVQLTH